MSSYQVIRTTSEALRSLMWNELSAETDTAALVPSKASIVLANPSEAKEQNSNRLSLWLYHVTEDEHMKNRPMRRVDDPTPGRSVVSQFPALALRLYYLITPFAQTGESDQLILGRVMQAAYDNAILVLNDPSIDVVEELRIVLYRNTLEEQTRIWDALNEPYRLSITYQVKVALVDSQRLPANARVVDRQAFLPNPQLAGV